MSEHVAIQLVGFLLLAIGAQWVAWRLKIPAILLLLLVGFAIGPGMQALGHSKLIDPDQLLGNLLVPLVSFSVAVVLFEGGFSLNLYELAHDGTVIRNLVSVGALATWIVATAGAHYVLAVAWPLASLLGAILIVTGPTVIGPLLRHVRPIGQTGPILKWEGIVIDPIGAMFTVLVFEAIPKGNMQDMTVAMGLGLLKICLVGGVIGALAARFLTAAFQRFWVPDYLQNPLTLTAIVAVLTGSNLLANESGLLAVTVMGILLGNQQRVTLTHIAEFKENLSVLLIGVLFVLFSARLTIEQVQASGVRASLFTLLLIVVARPLAVALSTIRSGLSWRERLLLAWMAPRGIVAASVASLFALRLAQVKYPGSEVLVPVVFTVIVGTVTFYGLTAAWVSRRLQLSTSTPGFLIAGANQVACELAKALQNEGLNVLLVDSRFELVRQARLAGIPVLYGSVLSQFVQKHIELTGIARLLAVTPNEEANSLAALKFLRVFGREQVFQVAPDAGEQGRKQKVAPELQGRALFSPGVTYEQLAQRFEQGHVIKRTELTDTFGFQEFCALYSENALLLFLQEKFGHLHPICDGQELALKSGDVLLSLVAPLPAAAQ